MRSSYIRILYMESTILFRMVNMLNQSIRLIGIQKL